jgi:hypothetical protein
MKDHGRYGRYPIASITDRVEGGRSGLSGVQWFENKARRAARPVRDAPATYEEATIGKCHCCGAPAMRPRYRPRRDAKGKTIILCRKHG